MLLLAAFRVISAHSDTQRHPATRQVASKNPSAGAVNSVPLALAHNVHLTQFDLSLQRARRNGSGWAQRGTRPRRVNPQPQTQAQPCRKYPLLSTMRPALSPRAPSGTASLLPYQASLTACAQPKYCAATTLAEHSMVKLRKPQGLHAPRRKTPCPAPESRVVARGGPSLAAVSHRTTPVTPTGTRTLVTQTQDAFVRTPQNAAPPHEITPHRQQPGAKRPWSQDPHIALDHIP